MLDKKAVSTFEGVKGAVLEDSKPSAALVQRDPRRIVQVFPRTAVPSNKRKYYRFNMTLGESELQSFNQNCNQKKHEYTSENRC